MDYDLEYGARFEQTFGGEFTDPEAGTFDDYGFQLGDLTVHNLTGEEFSKFVCSAMNHLMLNGHRFEFVKTGEIDLPLQMQTVTPERYG